MRLLDRSVNNPERNDVVPSPRCYSTGELELRKLRFVREWRDPEDDTQTNSRLRESWGSKVVAGWKVRGGDVCGLSACWPHVCWLESQLSLRPVPDRMNLGTNAGCRGIRSTWDIRQLSLWAQMLASRWDEAKTEQWAGSSKRPAWKRGRVNLSAHGKKTYRAPFSKLHSTSDRFQPLARPFANQKPAISGPVHLIRYEKVRQSVFSYDRRCRLPSHNVHLRDAQLFDRWRCSTLVFTSSCRIILDL